MSDRLLSVLLILRALERLDKVSVCLGVFLMV